MDRSLRIAAFIVILGFAALFIGFSKGFEYLSPRFDPCIVDSTVVGATNQGPVNKIRRDPNDNSQKDANDVLFKALEDNYSRYFDNIFKVVGFIIVAIGWILTSDKSRDFLQKNIVAYRVSIAAVFIIACGHAVALGFGYISSLKLVEQLREIGYLDCKYFTHYQISYIQICGSILSDTLLFTALLTILLSLQMKSAKNLNHSQKAQPSARS
jgi:hypothetical protein